MSVGIDRVAKSLARSTLFIQAGVVAGIRFFASAMGATLAPLLFGDLLVPQLGPKAVLLAIVFAYLLLVPTAYWKRPRNWISAFSAAALGFFAGSLMFIDLMCIFSAWVPA